LREYGVTTTDADFLVLDATRADKLSVHVHCPTVVFRTRLDLSLFMILVLEEIVALERAGKETSLVYMHKELRCFVIDPRVYRTATAYAVSLFRVGVKAPARRGDAEHWLRPAPWWDGWRPTVSDGEAARAEI